MAGSLFYSFSLFVYSFFFFFSFSTLLSRPARKEGFLKVQCGKRMRNETQEFKVRIRELTMLQGEGVKTESKPALLYFQP